MEKSTPKSACQIYVSFTSPKQENVTITHTQNKCIPQKGSRKQKRCKAQLKWQQFSEGNKKCPIMHRAITEQFTKQSQIKLTEQRLPPKKEKGGGGEPCNRKTANLVPKK